MDIALLIPFGIGLFLGFLGIWLIYRLQIHSHILSAQFRADDLIEAAQHRADDLEESSKLEVEAHVSDFRDREEPKIEKWEQTISEKDSEFRKRNKKERRKLKEQKRKQDSRTHDVKVKERHGRKLKNRYENRKGQYKNLTKTYIEALEKQHQLDRTEIQKDLVTELFQQADRESHQYWTHYVQEIQEDSEDIAKKVLHIAFNRFHRPYSSERGIPLVFFPSEKARKMLEANDKERLLKIQEICGCDIHTEEGNQLINIAGFDPVRREHTRRVFEKLFKWKKFDDGSIKKAAKEAKRGLINVINRDGKAIAKELKQGKFHKEILHMLGSLKYRYSFTQNQYFHVGEVGWLAGLLASEINENSKYSRRSGLLHDIGKSMDHMHDGGHAMIGGRFHR